MKRVVELFGVTVQAVRRMMAEETNAPLSIRTTTSVKRGPTNER
jgi:hypothetical protein